MWKKVFALFMPFWTIFGTFDDNFAESLKLLELELCHSAGNIFSVFDDCYRKRYDNLT